MASILSQITSECTGNSNDWTKNCPVNNTEHTNLRDKFLLSLVQFLNPREVLKKRFRYFWNLREIWRFPNEQSVRRKKIRNVNH